MPPKKTPTAKNPTPDIRVVDVALPVQKVDAATSCPRHIDIRLNHEQAIAFRGLFDGLHEQGAKIKGTVPGTTKYVNTPSDAVKYVLEQLL